MLHTLLAASRAGTAKGVDRGKLMILDCRGRVMAHANSLTGKGTEQVRSTRRSFVWWQCWFVRSSRSPGERVAMMMMMMTHTPALRRECVCNGRSSRRSTRRSPTARRSRYLRRGWRASRSFRAETATLR